MDGDLTRVVEGQPLAVREHPVQQAPERPDVRLGADALAQVLHRGQGGGDGRDRSPWPSPLGPRGAGWPHQVPKLGRTVRGCRHALDLRLLLGQDLVRADLALEEGRRAEIAEAPVAVRLLQHVLGLDVAVRGRGRLRVHRRDALADLGKDRQLLFLTAGEARAVGAAWSNCERGFAGWGTKRRAACAPDVRGRQMLHEASRAVLHEQKRGLRLLLPHEAVGVEAHNGLLSTLRAAGGIEAMSDCTRYRVTKADIYDGDGSLNRRRRSGRPRDARDTAGAPSRRDRRGRGTRQGFQNGDLLLNAFADVGAVHNHHVLEGHRLARRSVRGVVDGPVASLREGCTK